MTRTTFSVVRLLLLFVALVGVMFAGVHKDYGVGCVGNCDKRMEDASQHCLAETIYYEAGNQPLKGKVAVAFVVINRANRNDISICKVVRQPGQFSWYRNRALRRKRKNPAQWAECQELATQILANPDAFDDPTHGAIAFRRKWDHKFSRRWVASVRIGNHIFYVER